MTKARIQNKAATWLTTAQQVAVGRGVNKFWGDVAPAGAMAV
jgi:hypothetical protein